MAYKDKLSKRYNNTVVLDNLLEDVKVLICWGIFKKDVKGKLLLHLFTYSLLEGNYYFDFKNKGPGEQDKIWFATEIRVWKGFLRNVWKIWNLKYVNLRVWFYEPYKLFTSKSAMRFKVEGPVSWTKSDFEKK